MTHHFPPFALFSFRLSSKEQEHLVREICTKYGGSQFVFSKNEKERQELWRARKAALFASKVHSPPSSSRILGVDF